jgi:diguanylate cyclase (GGDEF)-like protein/PAS domain S-box-containing protein
MARRSAGDEARVYAAVLQAFEEAGTDWEPVLDLVCRLGVELTGDPWIIRLVEDDAHLRLAASAAPDAETLADIRCTIAPLTARYSTCRVAAVRGDGRPMVLTPEILDANRASAEPALLELAERRGFNGGIVAPMRVRGRVVGVLWWACQHHAEQHDEDDLRFVSSVADRCALAVDNARLLQRIEAERNRHAALLAQVGDAVCVVDAAAVVTHVIPGGVERVLGFGPDDLLGVNVFDLVHRKDHEEAVVGFVHAIGPDDLAPMTLRVRHRDGSWRHLRVGAQNLLDDPAVNGIVITGRDVTDQVHADALLNDENDILEQVAMGSPLNDTLDAICRMVDGHVRHAVSTIWLVDDEHEVLLPTAGPNAGPLPNIDPEHSRHGAEFARTLRPDAISISRPETGAEWGPWRESAIESGIACSWTRPIRDTNESVYGAVILYRGEYAEPNEVERKAIELAARLAAVAVHRSRDADRLAHAATHDSVTGLPNRRLFLDRLQQAVARQARGSAPPSVLFVDLDRFKQVNDRAGHSAGDDVLRVLAERLLRTIRPSDVVARFGGDEFAVLCDETGDDDAVRVAERLLVALCEPIELAGRRHHLSASIGIATGRSGVGHDALIRRADVAMYRAKRQGAGGIVAYRSEMSVGLHDGLEHDLRRAVERDQIQVHYQPILDIRRGRWAGVEALARWRHPAHGWIPPTTFVALAEEIGLAIAFGERVLARVCADAATWADDPVMREHQIGINVSGRQLVDPRFVGAVERLLDVTGVDPRRFVLELTETTMMEEFESAQAAVAALQSIGMSLAIDDFGTGHSTLARLRQFPASILKLDRTFMTELTEDKRSETIVAAVVQLAHAVGMTVCAEGVETAEQLATVHRLGVDLAQGFLLSRPVAADDVRVVLASRPPVAPVVVLDGVHP